MKRVALILGVLACIALAATLSLKDRSIPASSVHAQISQPSVVKLPPGTHVLIRLVENISEGSKEGDSLEGIIAEPVFANAQLLIPDYTRAGINVLKIEDHASNSDVTLELSRLIFSNRNVPVHSSTITTGMKRISDLELMARAAGGMIGGAVGAAVGASSQRNPTLGAGVMGSRSAGRISGKGQETLLFQVLEPVDLTGVAW